MQKSTLTFLLILSTLFIFGQIAIARPNVLPRGLSKQGHKLALNKRVTVNNQYVPDNLLSYAYFTFTDKVISGMQHAKSQEESYAILAEVLESKEDKFIDACHKVSNATAKAAHRTETSSRYVIILQTDQESNIDPHYGYSVTAKVACWEYDLKGDINKPIAQYTGQIINQLHLDIATARAYLEAQHKRLPGN